MTVQDTSLLAYEKIKLKLNQYQSAVLAILEKIGPTHDLRILEALNQKEKLRPRREKRIWHINEVTGRRNELVSLGIVYDLGTYSDHWCGEKKTYHFWWVMGDKREPIGWVKVKTRVRRPRSPEQTKLQKNNYERIRRDAGRAVLEKLTASRAGQILVQHRIRKQRKPQRKEQLLFA